MTTRPRVAGPLLALVTPPDGIQYGVHDLIAPTIRGARIIPVPPPAVPCMAFIGLEPCEQPSSVGLLRPGIISALYLCPSCYRLMR